MVFGNAYSKYYNLLYQDKNYSLEYDYICRLINQCINTPPPPAASIQQSVKNVLDIGCGTGKHLGLFKKDGFAVSGVDVSENMISEAKKYLNQEKDLLCGKASEFKFDRKFDVIVSLFHVMSYQTTNDELEKVFMNVSQHLNADGLFIFDFWYGPAVLSDPPSIRIKRMEDTDIHVTRITEPVMRYNENIVDVNFEVLIEDKKTHFIEKINETHIMRYLFLPEIKHLSKAAGLSFAGANKWLDFSPLSDQSWYGLVVLKK